MYQNQWFWCRTYVDFKHIAMNFALRAQGLACGDSAYILSILNVYEDTFTIDSVERRKRYE